VIADVSKNMKAFALILLLLPFIDLCQGADGERFVYDLNPYMYQYRGEDLILHCNARMDGEIFGLVAIRFINKSKSRQIIEEKIKDSSFRYSYFRLTSGKKAEKQAVVTPPRIDLVTSDSIDQLNAVASRTDERNQNREITEIIDFREISQNEILGINPKIIHVKIEK
jgi:hypothetical protein